MANRRSDQITAASPTSGEGALRGIVDHAPPPTVIGTDVNLGPGMGGVALAAEVRRRWPAVRLVVATGDTRNPDRLVPGSCEGAYPGRDAGLLQGGRLIGEIKRRTDVVGIVRNEAAVVRLVGAILLEQSDEWATQRSRCMMLEAISTVSETATVSLSAVPT